MSPEVYITGMGVVSAVGTGKYAFFESLLEGKHNFDYLARPGRASDESFLGAEISKIDLDGILTASELRTVSLSSKAAVKALAEAWDEARLNGVDAKRIGLVIGGSNVQQRELFLSHERYRDKTCFLRPSYGMTFMDSDILGLCTSTFSIRGMGFTCGAASGSGQIAVIEAAEAVRSGRVDACIAVGALMDVSMWECLAFRAAGAMGGWRFKDCPGKAYRPFDSERDGFVYGESCAAVVIANEAVQSKAKNCYAKLSGWSTVLDGNRYPDPSLEGECYVIRQALVGADLSASDIDYINPHGSGSLVGDKTELEALSACGLEGKPINATKSITGHGLCAAGAVEIVATALQMNSGELHPSRNLESPISDAFDWVKERRSVSKIRNSLCMSMGFGGINSAVCLSQ